MKPLFHLAICGVACWMQACDSNHEPGSSAKETPIVLAAVTPPEPEPLSGDPKAAARANNTFAVELYGKLGSKTKGNVFFSPYSISTALAMLHAGAAGQTRAEMAALLHLNGSMAEVNAGYRALTESISAAGKAGGFQLNVANALWVQQDYPFLPSYINTLKQSYNANLFAMAFVAAPEASRRSINGWVAQQTKDKIRDLIRPPLIDRYTRFLLTNAVYFKGDWSDAFDKSLTRDMPFHCADGKQVETPMMHRKNYSYVEEKDFEATAISYRNSDLRMIILLPKKKDGLLAFEKKLTAERLADISTQLAQSWASVDMYIPKFKISHRPELTECLQSMGMLTAFTEQADLSGISGEKPLYIGSAVHKAFVEVNEEGTEAAAATAIVGPVLVGGPYVKTIVFKADRPFMFLIQDRATSAILFMGRMANPGEKATE